MNKLIAVSFAKKNLQNRSLSLVIMASKNEISVITSFSNSNSILECHAFKNSKKYYFHLIHNLKDI